MPADLKKAIADAFFNAPTKGKDAFAKLTDGKSPGFAPAKHEVTRSRSNFRSSSTTCARSAVLTQLTRQTGRHS